MANIITIGLLGKSDRYKNTSIVLTVVKLSGLTRILFLGKFANFLKTNLAEYDPGRIRHLFRYLS